MTLIPRIRDQAHKKRLPYVLMVLLLIPSLYWIAHDKAIWAWDEAWYGEVSVDLWGTLINHPSGWWSAMVSAFGVKAPGIAWLGQLFVPLGQLVGSVEFGLLLSISIVQFGTLVLTYKLGRELIPNQIMAPLVGSVFVAAAPLFIALSHLYFVEPLQLFAVTYFFWIAAKSYSLGKTAILGHLLLAADVALIAKVDSPIYCFFPGCIALYEFFTCERKDATVVRNSMWRRAPTLVVGIAIFLVGLVWYWRNYSALRDFIVLAVSSDLPLDYGRKDIFVNKLSYWLVATQQSFAIPTVLAIVGAVALLGVAKAVMRLAGERRFQINRFDFLALAALVHVALVLTLLSVNIVEENRYLLPLLPSIVVLVLWALSQARNRYIGIAVLSALIGQWTFVHARTLGFIQPIPNISYWVRPINIDRVPMNEMERLITLTCNSRTENRYNIVGVELPWLNANSLSFFSAKARLTNNVRCYYTSLGYAEKDSTRAWDRLNSMKIASFISLEKSAHPELPNFINQVSLPIFQKIRNDSHFAQQPFESELKIVVFGNQDDAAR